MHHFAADLLRLLAAGLRRVATAVLALLILFEEWGWEPLQRLMARLGRLPVIHWLEARIAALPPRAALAVLLVPTLVVLPIKLGAVWLIAQGHLLTGTLVIVAAKVAGTAVVARLFTLTRPALLRLAWFARFYPRWLAWKATVLARVRTSLVWRQVRAMKAQLRQTWRRWRRGPG